MKKFLGILSVLAMMIIVACSEDIFLHDGKDGLNGKDGRNGYDVYFYVDSLANMKVWYQNRDNNPAFTSGDSILYRENQENIQVIPNGECWDVIMMVGTTPNYITTICNGRDGTNGTDAHNLIPGSEYLVNQDGDTIGSLVSFYWDMQDEGEPGYGVLSSGDLLKYSFPVYNGKDGQNGTNGTNGSTPQLSINTVGDNIVYVVSIDGIIQSTTSIPLPQNGTNGTNGLAPSLKAIETCLGVTYIWYLDLNSNGKFDSGIDTKLSENTVLNGKDGNPSSSIVSLTEEYDFQTGCATYVTNTGFKLDGFVLSVADGALYLEKSSGYVEFPPFGDNMDLLSIRLNYGSVNPYDFTVKAVYADGSEKTIKTVHLDANPSFNRAYYSTYSQFEYYADLDNIKFKDVKAIKICASVSAKCVPQNLFIDQVIICLWDKNVH